MGRAQLADRARREGPVWSSRFREKPPIEVARALLEQGAVWNTFVMVGHIRAFLEMVRAAVPELLRALAPARLWDGEKIRIAAPVYEHIPSVCFSHSVLTVEARRLAVLRLNVGWSDLVDPGRAVMAVRDSGYGPPWIGEWKFPSVQVTDASKAATAATAT